MNESEKGLREVLDVLSAFLKHDYTGRLPLPDDNQVLRQLYDRVNAVGEMLLRQQTEHQHISQAYETTSDLYKGLFEYNALAVLILRFSDQVIIDVNDACVRLFGFERKEEIIGRRGADLDLLTDQALRDKAITETLQHRQTTNHEAKVRTRSGDCRWITGTSNVINIDGEDCMLCLMMDITGKKKVEEEIANRTADLEEKMKALQESEEKFLKAFHASSSGITITRIADGRYVDVNDAYVKISGYSREELIGKTSEELGMVVSIPVREKALREISEHGRLREYEISIINKSGVHIDLLFSSETIMVSGEKFSLNQIYDITERKQTELQLQFLNKELEAFSYSVSHDLRAPLRILNGYSEMLEEDFNDQLNDSGREMVRVIRRNVGRMNDLIENLLEFSRMGRKELVKKDVDMNQIVADVRNELNESQHHAKVTVTILPRVKADKALLHQVVYNLLANAIKYSSRKEKPVITIGYEDKGNEFIFWVEDNGAGFDPAYADRLFGVFQRLHTKDDFPGVGVGLAIVQRIVFRHGGRVWATAVKDKGATFYFSLPR